MACTPLQNAKLNNFRKISVGESQKSLILEGSALSWGVNFSSGGGGRVSEFLGKMLKFLGLGGRSCFDGVFLLGFYTPFHGMNFMIPI